jgi:hypothetical protein
VSSAITRTGRMGFQTSTTSVAHSLPQSPPRHSHGRLGLPFGCGLLEAGGRVLGSNVGTNVKMAFSKSVSLAAFKG